MTSTKRFFLAPLLAFFLMPAALACGVAAAPKAAEAPPATDELRAATESRNRIDEMSSLQRRDWDGALREINAFEKKYGGDEAPEVRKLHEDVLKKKIYVLGVVGRPLETLAAIDDYKKRYSEEGMFYSFSKGPNDASLTVLKSQILRNLGRLEDEERDTENQGKNDKPEALPEPERTARTVYDSIANGHWGLYFERAIATLDEIDKKYGALPDARPALRLALFDALMLKGKILRNFERLFEAKSAYLEAWRRYGGDPDPEIANRAFEAFNAYRETGKDFAYFETLLPYDPKIVALEDKLFKRLQNAATPPQLKMLGELWFSRVHRLQTHGQIDAARAEIAAIKARFAPMQEKSLQSFVSRTQSSLDYMDSTQIDLPGRIKRSRGAYDYFIKRGNSAETDDKTLYEQAQNVYIGIRDPVSPDREKGLAALRLVVETFAKSQNIEKRQFAAESNVLLANALVAWKGDFSAFDGLERRFVADSDAGIRFLVFRALLEKARALARNARYDEAFATYDRIANRPAAQSNEANGEFAPSAAIALLRKFIWLGRIGRYQDAIDVASRLERLYSTPKYAHERWAQYLVADATFAQAPYLLILGKRTEADAQYAKFGRSYGCNPRWNVCPVACMRMPCDETANVCAEYFIESAVDGMTSTPRKDGGLQWLPMPFQH
jgi:hypothetical protein